MIDPKELAGLVLTKYEAADRLRISYRTMENLVNAGCVPKIKFGPLTVRYHLDDLRAYVMECKEAVTESDTYGLNPNHEFEREIRKAMGVRFPEGTQLVTRSEAASWLGVSTWTISNWADSGKLARVVLSPTKIVRFDAHDVVELIDSRRPARRGVWDTEPLEPKAVTMGAGRRIGSGRR